MRKSSLVHNRLNDPGADNAIILLLYHIEQRMCLLDVYREDAMLPLHQSSLRRM